MATLRETFGSIADAIRAKGVEGTMTPLEMPEKIGEIQTGGGYEYLTFRADGQSSTVKMQKVGTTAPDLDLLYSYDRKNWTQWRPYADALTIADGQSVFIRGGNAGNTVFAKNSSNYNNFVMTGRVACEGKITALCGEGGVASLGAKNYFATRLFSGCTALVSAPELPARILSTYSYMGMYNGCTSLVSVPELPATTVGTNSYEGMFFGCTSLVSAPRIAATTLANYCFREMFCGCTNLLTPPPELPAETATQFCCYYMFSGCTKLTGPIKIGAKKLAQYAFYFMFDGCRNLNNVKIAYDGNFLTSTNAFDLWMNDVGSVGVLYYNGTDTTRGSSAIPTLWTVEPFDPEG